MTTFVAPLEKFRDYIFKPGATHGKDRIFRSLGYDSSHSDLLSEIYSLQAAKMYANGDYTLGKVDEYGQRVSIVIALNGRADAAENVIHLISGWMIRPDETVTLNTPFSGFARQGAN